MKKLEQAQPQYGFYDRLNASFPSQLIIDTTELCNLACIHCPHPEFKKSEHYTARSQDGELSAKAIDEVRDHGQGICQYVRFTGEGEPLIHRGIFEILTYAVQNSGTMVTLTTNGTLLTPQRIEQVLATGVGLIDISIDAFSPETYAAVRVKGDLNVTRQNVLNLLAAAKGGPVKIIVSYVEQPANKHETDDFERFWRESGAEHVVVRRLHSSAGAVGGVADRLRTEVSAGERRPCLYPWERLTLNPRGELVFCPQDWIHGSVVVDYRKTTIKETWSGEFMQRLRQAHLSNDYSQHAFCGQCPDWKGTNWPASDSRAYADMIAEFKAKE